MNSVDRCGWVGALIENCSQMKTESTRGYFFTIYGTKESDK